MQTTEPQFYAVPSVEYANGVTLYAKVAEGWPVADSNGERHLFASIPAFMDWAAENHGWPMA